MNTTQQAATVDPKILQAEIRQSLLSAADALFTSPEWIRTHMGTPLKEKLVQEMLIACAANLARPLAERMVQDCDTNEQLADAFEAAARSLRRSR